MASSAVKGLNRLFCGYFTGDEQVVSNWTSQSYN